MYKIITTIAAIIATTLPARANIQSKTLYAQALCDGQDQIAALTNGWEHQKIQIVGVELTVLQGGDTLQYGFAGNSYVPDAMALLGQQQVHVVNWFPAGLGFDFPPMNSGQHLDMHIGCTGGNQMEGYETFYYVLAP